MALRKTLFNLVIATLLAGLTPGTSAASDGHEILVGYKVKTHPRVSSEDAKRAKKHLEDRLKITQKAAPKLYSALRDKVTFWISDSQNQKSAATYHPSAKWLTDNKLDPAMAKGIEIMSIKNFVEWAKDGDQPMMVLHELAHAYHDQVLGESNQVISNAYRKATEGGKYEKVDYGTTTGDKRRAYALTDEREYFAELAEAYFGRNDYFPFERSDLQGFDPTGFQAVKTLLGP
jgi:hypothetical protein